MKGLLVFKEQLKSLYAKYSYIIIACLKFLISYLSFYLMNDNIGFMTSLKSPMIILILSLICAVLPYSAITIISAGFMMAHLYTLSFEIALLSGIFLLLVALLYYGFQPGDSYLLLLTPMMFLFKIPYVVPLLVGLAGGLASAIPVGCGVIIYYLLSYVKQNAGLLTNDAAVDITQKYVQIINGIFMSNQLMIIMIAAFSISILVVYLIKKLSVDYAWIIAVAAGTVAQLIVIFMGNVKYNISVPMGQLIFGAVISVLIAGVFEFFVFALDYSRTEYTQFEDDDYYYYVKAVPKITISKTDVKVQKINSRRIPRSKPAKKQNNK